ncbi:MAG TPA: hypothetical protein VFM94_08305 [Solirubrobacterales bacterium]|nr:hypothetical protein [Solirubrobacterales bacterium]
MGAMLLSLGLFCAMASSASATPVGVYMAGEESEEVASQPRFEAESYPVKVNGNSLSSHKQVVQAGYVECQIVDFFGAASAATPTLAFSPVRTQCGGKSNGGSSVVVTIMSHECKYVLHALNAGPPYVGTFGIECPPEVNGYEYIAAGVCHIVYPPQTGVAGVSFENTGTGSERKIKATFNVTSLKYTQSAGCGKAGEFTNGTYTGSELLFGEK